MHKDLWTTMIYKTNNLHNNYIKILNIMVIIKIILNKIIVIYIEMMKIFGILKMMNKILIKGELNCQIYMTEIFEKSKYMYNYKFIYKKLKNNLYFLSFI